jgi:hypothetical protein
VIYSYILFALFTPILPCIVLEGSWIGGVPRSRKTSRHALSPVQNKWKDHVPEHILPDSGLVAFLSFFYFELNPLVFLFLIAMVLFQILIEITVTSLSNEMARSTNENEDWTWRVGLLESRAFVYCISASRWTERHIKSTGGWGRDHAQVVLE